MLAGDDVAAATAQARSWSEDRVQHWWDGGKEMSRLFAQTLGLQGPAWDVYLLYPTGVRWEGETPAAPNFWMHQLPDAAAAPELSLRRAPWRLAGELDTLLQQ
jgi:hypothetical protein